MAQTINLVISDALALLVQTRAAAAGVTPAVYVRTRLRQIIIDEEQANYAAAQEAARIAAVTSALSTAAASAQTATAANLATLSGAL